MRSRSATTFFSETEKAKIHKAIQSVELNTAGEVAVMVVDHSDRYREGVLLGALFLSGLIALIICVVAGHITIWSYIPLVFITFLPTRYLFLLIPRLKLAFIGTSRIVEAVHERALRAFFEKGLYRTKYQTGILLFISLLERKVWIIGDRAINEKIAPDSWQALASEIALGVKEKRPCEALCSVIEKCGAELQKHFPRRPDDTNELVDELIYE